MPFDTEEAILKLGIIDPEFDEPDWSDLNMWLEISARRLAQTKLMFAQVPASMLIEEMAYTASDGTKLRAKVFKPAEPPAGGCPLVVIFHGGGFCVGAPESEEPLCRNLVEHLGVICISAEYRLAPKFKFPCAVDDSWDSLKWAAANAVALGADPSRGFIVGGSSAGGNITAILTHFARDEKLQPPLTGQHLGIPSICPPDQLPEKYKKRAPILSKGALMAFEEAYQPDRGDSLKFSILNHPKGHSDLPPAYFTVNGMDTLRDDALIYERVLREEYNIKTKLDVYSGLPHGHWAYFPMLKSIPAFRQDQIKGFAWLLENHDSGTS